MPQAMRSPLPCAVYRREWMEETFNIDIVEDDEELYEVSNLFEKRLREFFDIEQ